jgi:glycosyltransferase involved in cell wall biosynthesis
VAPNSITKRRVNIYIRKSAIGQYSIEKLFHTLAEGFHCDELFDIHLISMPYLSKGLINRVRNILFAMRQKADIHHISGDIHYIVFAFERSKSVITIHDLALLYHLQGIKLLLFKTIWFTLPTWWAKKLVVISEKTKEDLIKYIDPCNEKISIISNFVNPKYNITQNIKKLKAMPLILHIGTAPHKNLVRLIDAINGLRVKLHIVGILTDDYLELLERGNIDFVNFTNLSESDLIDQYNQADIIHFASTFEGFGMPILEGQAMGVPVITSDLAPMKDVAVNGSAYLVNPFVASEIRNAVLDILQNEKLRENLINNGFQNVKKYVLSHIVSDYRELYSSIIRVNNKN